MNKEDYCVVFITTDDRENAIMIADKLLKAHLAACVNIVEGVDSFYWWKGEINHSKEFLLIVKTKFVCFDKLSQAVRELHRYSLPEIIAVPINEGTAEYLGWIDENIKI